MTEKSKNIFVIAGEASGDKHSAALIKELKKLIPEVSFSGIGGPEMAKENAKLLYNLSEVNFIGFYSVAKNIKKIKSIFDRCIKEIRTTHPEAVILVDYPGFNLKLASKIRKFYKGKIIYYISPQLWAWHKSRVKIIRETVDLMIVVFEFEVDFYARENVKAVFAGHPLVKSIDEFLKKNHKTTKDKIQISFLPGSRKEEIEKMLPALIKSAEKFSKEFDCNINFICTTNFPLSFFKNFIKTKNFNLIYDKDDSGLNYKTILDSDLVITKSGTSTMECALIGTPFCVVYKTGRLNYSIGKRLVKVDHIAMPNILLDKKAVKEFLQNDMTPENIFNEGEKLLTDSAYREKMLADFKKLREVLTEEDASRNAAEFIFKIITNP